MARGSAPGERRGGRQKGVKNKATVERENGHAEIIAEAKAEGLQPLEYMLKIMRDTSADDKRRDTMAIAAAGYVHPKLSSIEGNITGRFKHDVDDYSDEELAAIAVGSRSGHTGSAGGSQKSN